MLEEFDETFDLIFSINVLEHIENDQLYLKQIYEKLSRNGRLKIFIPARQELFSSFDQSVGHYRRYSKKQLEKLIQQCGFKIEDSHYADFLGYFIALFYKWFFPHKKVTQQNISFYDKVIFPISHLLDRLTCGKMIGKNVMIECRKEV